MDQTATRSTMQGSQLQKSTNMIALNTRPTVASFNQLSAVPGKVNGNNRREGLALSEAGRARLQAVLFDGWHGSTCKHAAGRGEVRAARLAPRSAALADERRYQVRVERVDDGVGLRDQRFDRLSEKAAAG